MCYFVTPLVRNIYHFTKQVLEDKKIKISFKNQLFAEFFIKKKKKTVSY